MKKNIAVFVIIFLAFLGSGQGYATSPGSDDLSIDSVLDEVELIPVMINGDKDNRINIVIMNRWSSGDKEPYNSPEMREEFLKDIDESLVAALTPGDERAQTAYANYHKFFNVYGLWWPDTPEWGKGVDLSIADSIRSRLFLPWKDEHTGWVTFLVMPNLDGGGGGAARNLEERVGNALIVGNGIGKMLHEISHTCMSIGDEYTAGATGTSAVPTYVTEREYRRDKIKWQKWIEPDTPLPTPYTPEYRDKVGAFEGSQYHLTGYYRSTAQSCIMGAGVFDNTEEMCPVCEQRVAMRVYDLVNPINDIYPKDKIIHADAGEKLHFQIDHIKPEPNTQVVRWFLNGKLIASGTDELNIEPKALSEYKLICTLTDETAFIRPDPPFAQYPERKIEWTIINKYPQSSAKNIEAAVKYDPPGRRSEGYGILEAEVSGGTAPYSFIWSTGDTLDEINIRNAGIYELKVFDSEFRSTNISYSVPLLQKDETPSKRRNSTAGKNLKINAEITASEIGKDNGKIILKAEGGKEPYTFTWSDENYKYGKQRIYEAEKAKIEIPDYALKEFFSAGGDLYLDFNGNEGSVIWEVEVMSSGIYPVDIIYAGISPEGIEMNLIINGQPADKALIFPGTRPLYTGWEEVSYAAVLNQGKNIIELKSKGSSGANIDYLRIPDVAEPLSVTGAQRINLKHGTYGVTVKDKNGAEVRREITVPLNYPFRINELKVEKKDARTLRIIDPAPGYSYKWYLQDRSLFYSEQNEEPVAIGTEFAPSGPGTFYIAAQNDLTHAESENRICISVGNGSFQTGNISAMNPFEIGDRHIKLWFDASDLDGDEHDDGFMPERGPLKDWREKIWRNRGSLFVKYEPNVLNGKGVGDFANVWVQGINKEVKDYKTIIMVYRESGMSFPGTSPFRSLSKYIGMSSEPAKRLFDPEYVDEKTKHGNVWLNGKKVDPFTTPNPMEFCILTVELDSLAEDAFNRTEGYWEGAIAEMIIIDRDLTEEERQGIEEYLRKKWFAAVDLEF